MSSQAISLSVKYLTDGVVMEVARPYESPFTDISQQGPAAMFSGVVVTEIVKTLEIIRLRAVG